MAQLLQMVHELELCLLLLLVVVVVPLLLVLLLLLLLLWARRLEHRHPWKWRWPVEPNMALQPVHGRGGEQAELTTRVTQRLRRAAVLTFVEASVASVVESSTMAIFSSREWYGCRGR